MSSSPASNTGSRKRWTLACPTNHVDEAGRGAAAVSIAGRAAVDADAVNGSVSRRRAVVLGGRPAFATSGNGVMLLAQFMRAKIMAKHYSAPPARHLVREARRARTDQAVADLAPLIVELRAAGVTSLRAIAAALNKRGIPTVAGSGRWYHTQVGRLLARLTG